MAYESKFQSWVAAFYTFGQSKRMIGWQIGKCENKAISTLNLNDICTPRSPLQNYFCTMKSAVGNSKWSITRKKSITFWLNGLLENISSAESMAECCEQVIRDAVVECCPWVMSFNWSQTVKPYNSARFMII